MGINAMILSSFLEGESRDVGTVFASLAREIQNYGNPIQAALRCHQLRRGHDKDHR
ncbi:MAG: hypothetical protein ACLSHJ_04890 [Oscillospiraceae bacterium]